MPDWHGHWNKDDYFTKNPYISNESTNLLIKNEISGISIDLCSIDKIL